MDTTAALWLEIDQLHLKYLRHEDNVAKIELRSRLEARVKEYLSCVTQDRKFVSSSTGDILNNSVRWISDFSLGKAAEAFQCIEKYAANLLNQPWRVEYRTIKQFNGFYMHNIKSVLSGAEKLFFAMGYNRDPQDPETFKLETRNGEVDINLDTVTQVARDCLLARMESIILQDIHNGVAAQFPLGLDELLEFRRDHIGSPETAVRELLYRKNQSRIQFPAGQPFNNNQVYSPYAAQLAGYPNFHGPAAAATVGNSGGFHPIGPGFGPTSFSNGGAGGVGLSTPTAAAGGQFANGGLTMANGLASNPYQTGVVSHQYPLTGPAVLNGYGGVGNSVQANGLIQNGIMSPAAANGLIPGNGASGLPSHVTGLPGHLVAPSSLPTRLACTGNGASGSGNGNRLIDHSPAGSSTSTLRQGQIPTTILDLCSGDDNRRGENGARPRERVERPERVKSREFEAKDRGRRGRSGREKGRASGGGDEIESWDFVYKELEQQGYSKDQAERPDILANNRAGFDDAREGDLTRNINQLRLDDTRERSRAVRNKSRNRASQEISRDHVLTSESEQEVSRYSSADSRPGMQERPARGNRVHNQGNNKHNRPGSDEKWECAACTFHNSMSTNICEMCSKSKEKSYKTTLVEAIMPKQDASDGGLRGQECARCTLLNPPNTKVCDACGASLGLSPPI